MISIQDLYPVSVTDVDVAVAERLVADVFGAAKWVEVTDYNDGERQIEIGSVIAISGWGRDGDEAPSSYLVQRIVTTPATYEAPGDTDFVDVGEPHVAFSDALVEACAAYAREEALSWFEAHHDEF